MGSGGEAVHETGEESAVEGDIGLEAAFPGGKGGSLRLSSELGIEAMFAGVVVAFGGAAAARRLGVHESIIAQMFFDVKLLMDLLGGGREQRAVMGE